MSASAAVFDTAELFEAILLDLQPHDAIAYQRVSRQWRDFITSSKPLQRYLFLQPIPRNTLEDLAEDWYANPDWGTVKPSFLCTPVEVMFNEPLALYHVPVLLNQSLFTKPRQGMKGNIDIPRGLNFHHTIVLPDPRGCFLDFAFPAHNITTEDMVRKMYVSQPPVKQVQVHFAIDTIDEEGVHERYWKEHYVRDEDGVKVGQIIANMEVHLEKCKGATVYGAFLDVKERMVMTKQEVEDLEAEIEALRGVSDGEEHTE